MVLVHSPDRLARKFAYQALLIEELARCGVRVEFVKGPRGDSPEDQLLVQFQGMFAEYEKAQLAERYRRGKAWRAKSGSVNVLSGAPFGYRYVRKTPECGARYEVIPHEAALVTEMFRRYADDGAAIADLRRWLTDQGVPTRTGKERWDRSVIWGMLRNPAYAGTAVFGKTQAVHEQAGLNRTARLAAAPSPGRSGRRPAPGGMDRYPRPGPGGRGDVRPGAAAAGGQQAVRRAEHEGSLPAAGHRRLRVLRLRLLPHHHDHHRREQDLLLPVPRLRRLPLPGRQGLPEQARPRRLRQPGRLGPRHRPARRPRPHPRRDRQEAGKGAHVGPGHPQARPARAGPRQDRRVDRRDDHRVLRAAPDHRRAPRPHARPPRPRDRPEGPDRRPRRPGRRPRRLPQARRRPPGLPRPAPRQLRHRHRRGPPARPARRRPRRPRRPRETHHPPPHPRPGTSQRRRPPRQNRHGG